MCTQPHRADAPRRLLVINPNSNPAVTERIRQVADRVLRADTVADVVNPPGVPLSIETEAHRAAAEPQVIALIEAALSQGHHGYALACFDDIAIADAQCLAAVPVVGAVDASLALARTFARRFAIVTTVEAAVPGIHRLLQRYGASEICAVRAAHLGVAAAANFDENAFAQVAATVARSVSEDGAEAVILGSGGLAGRAAELSRAASVRIIDSTAAAIVLAAAAADLSRTDH